MKPIGVVRFPGTNCDYDVFNAIQLSGQDPKWLWHNDNFSWNELSGIVLPGGFSFGDYLRCGAMAAVSPVIKSVKEAAEHGVPILGICNGFQILCETHLLPGVLLRNENLVFIDKWVDLVFETQSPWDPMSKEISLPVAHGEGRFYANEDELKSIEDNQQVWCRYQTNINGSVNSIAGLVAGKYKNVCGLMPHPERAVEEWMGNNVGLSFFIEN
jgi:phosphoribosylformylglycinamidine synthase